MEFILDRLRDKNPDGSLSIMFVVAAYPVLLHADVELVLIGTPYMVRIPPATELLAVAKAVCPVGEKIFPEEELSHLDGHKGSKPVR